MIPEEVFSGSTTPSPAWISRAFEPPSQENFHKPIRQEGVDFLGGNPFIFGHMDSERSVDGVEKKFTLFIL